MASLTRWVLAHKRTVVLTWVVLTIAGIMAAGPATDALKNEFSVPDKEGWETNVEIAERFPFANLNLLNTPSFGLDFGQRSVTSAFSIEVIPEPSTALLLGAGLAGLAISGRARSAPPRA